MPLLPASHLYDAVILYATVVREIYEEMKEKNNETIDVERIGRDGLAIAQKLTNRTFKSK